MNTPNKLTILRILLVPLFLAFLLIGAFPYHNVFALIVFIAASITDSLDGHLARKNNQVTTFGKFLDPLADKILVLSAMICFVELSYVSAIVVVIMIAREFMVTSLRLVAAAGSGKVIAAGILGKIKTVIQMVSLIAILLLCAVSDFVALPQWLSIPVIAETLMWISAIASVISGGEYLWKNRKLVSQFE